MEGCRHSDPRGPPLLVQGRKPTARTQDGQLTSSTTWTRIEVLHVKREDKSAMEYSTADSGAQLGEGRYL